MSQKCNWTNYDLHAKKRQMRLIRTIIILFSGHPGALWLVWGSENEHHREFFPYVHLYMMALTRVFQAEYLRIDPIKEDKS